MSGVEQSELTVEELLEVVEESQVIFEKTLKYFKQEVEYEFNYSIAERMARDVAKFMVSDYFQLKYVDPDDL